MTDRLLLDTHIVLWLWADPDRVPRMVQERVLDAVDVYVSAASGWEVAIKQRLGRLSLPGPFADGVALAGFTELPVTLAQAEETRSLPMLHRDPFDRLLVAAARVEGLTLVTADPMVLAYPAESLDAR